MSPSYDLSEHFKQEITQPRRPRLESKQSSRARFPLKRVAVLYSIVLWSYLIVDLLHFVLAANHEEFGTFVVSWQLLKGRADGH